MVGIWRGAWFLAKHELKKERWKNLAMLALIGYVLLFTIPMFLSSMTAEQNESFNWVTDFIYMSLLPCFGFVMNNTMMNYKKDGYSKRLAYLRTLPVSPQQAALGRIIQLAILMLASQLLFFAAQYAFVYFSGIVIQGLDYILYALFWLGYSLTIAIFYVYWEIGYSGKVYFIACLAIALLFIAITVSINLLGYGNLVISSLRAIEEGKWWIALITPAICFISLPLGYQVFVNRLLKRNYNV